MKKGIVYKKRIRIRRDAELVNIDGTVLLWGKFRQKFFEDIDKKEMRGEKIGKRTFILNKGDPHKEKKLFWDPNTGFDSENSDDEAVKYARTERIYKSERDLRTGTDVYL
jgi:hypothetical protein